MMMIMILLKIKDNKTTARGEKTVGEKLHLV